MQQKMIAILEILKNKRRDIIFHAILRQLCIEFVFFF